jgi:hypothetical protein
MKLRIWIWTFGMAVSASPARETMGAIFGAIVGFCVGWGLQRLLDLGRRR